MKDMIYIEYDFTIRPKDPATEILIAELGNVGFESFVENEKGVVAYIQKEACFETILDEIFILNSMEFDIQFTKREIAQTNWNEEWEKNFEPIQVDDKVSVRAPFHDALNLPYEIVIEPKMSFGTGHHETTHMMIQHLLQLDLTNRKVLDMGSGTGILAIFAEMRGANPIDAIDIDHWCYLNALENIERNNCKFITAYEGDASLLEGKKYDLIIANINRNILVSDMPIYMDSLNQKGILLLSGFYDADVPIINNEVEKYGLSLQHKINRNDWVALKYY